MKRPPPPCPEMEPIPNGPTLDDLLRGLSALWVVFRSMGRRK